MGNCTGQSIPHKSLPKNSKDVLDSQCLMCNICALEYDLKDRIPMMLCINQHNACQICVQHIKNGLTLSCPFCRQEMEVDAIGRNRILMEILKEKEPGLQMVKREETENERLERILKEARECNLQKVIYYIEVGIDLTTVKELHLWNFALKAITDLSLFTGLKTLDLHKNHISEIKNLDKLKELTFLNLGYNEITTITNLDTLQKLQFLDLCHNKLTKIDNLSNNLSLKTLNLSYNTITVVQNLYLLSKLTILYLSPPSTILESNPLSLKLSSGSIQALQHRGVILQVNLLL